MRTATALLVLLPLLAAGGSADAGSGDKEPSDVLFRALGEELKRSMERLKLGSDSGPYFVGYAVEDVRSVVYRGSFGALVEKGSYRNRRLHVDVRTGSYDLDSTNFHGDLSFREQAALAMTGSPSEPRGISLSVEDDYDSLRNKIWGATDEAYKKAVERLGRKKGYLATRSLPDRKADFSREEPVASEEPEAKVPADKDRWESAVRRLSALFRETPAVERSLVVFRAEAENRWFVNSEGARSRRAETSASLCILAMGRAPDGTVVTDSEVLAGTGEKDLPSDKVLEELVYSLASRIAQLAAAPPAAPYTGPVLFEAPAAAELVYRGLGPLLGNAHLPVGETSTLSAVGHAFRGLVGRRVLPRFLTVVDDPTALAIGGVPLLGRRTLDDDGVAPRRVVLVEDGMLRDFCTSRIPSGPGLRSNGHSRGGVGRAESLHVSSAEALPWTELRARLLARGREEGLARVRIVRRLASPWGREMDPPAPGAPPAGLTQGASFTLPPPALLYEVSVADGTERLVRGARFAPASPRAFREIEAAGDDARALVVLRSTTEAAHVAAPSLLVREMELQPPEKSHEEPPLLPHPVFGERKKPR